MFTINNKKAGERYLSPWMFAIWGLVGLAIVIVTLIFYNSMGDVRLIEADLMATRILDCLSDSFNFSEVSASGFSIYSRCNLNENAFNNTNYYFNLRINSADSGTINGISISGGNDYSVDCAYRNEETLRNPAGATEENFAQCMNKRIIVKNIQDNKYYLLNITTASYQKIASGYSSASFSGGSSGGAGAQRQV